MANGENLRPLQSRSEEERKAIASAGGRASCEAKRRRKLLRETMEAILSMPEKNDKYISMMRARGIKKTDITQQAVIVMSQIEKAKKGDTKAATFIRDTVGEKPTERHEVTGADGTPFVSRQLTQSEAREFLRKLDEEL